MASSFLSVPNFETLRRVLDAFLKENHGVDLEADTDIDLDRTLFETMKDMRELHADLSVEDLNRLTLRHTRALIVEALAPRPQPAGGSSVNLPADRIIPVSSSAVTASSMDSGGGGFEQALAQQRAERSIGKEEDASKAAVNPDEPVKVTALTDDEFQRRLDELEGLRQAQEAEDAANAPAAANAAEGECAPPDDGGASTQLAPPSAEEQPACPLESLAPPLIPETTPIATTSMASIMPKTRYLVINSGDRDWINQPSRFKYRVKFTQTSSDIRRVPFYANNPTVPHTATLSSPGVPNSVGWYDASGVRRPPYDATSPPGELLGYEEIQVPIDEDANVQEKFRNVTCVSVSNVVVPMGAMRGANSAFAVHDFNMRYPYLLLRIDELDGGIIDGTDDAIRRAFCQLVFERAFETSSGRGYVVLKPAQEERRVFAPMPLSTLPALTMSITTPRGDLVNASSDGEVVVKLEYEAFNRLYVKVVTQKWFEGDAYAVGDVVLISAYTMFKLDADQDQEAVDRVNAWANRRQGHVIAALGDANDDGFRRAFYVRAPGGVDVDNGVYTVDQEAVQQLELFNRANDLTASPANGHILNVSLQNSVSITVTEQQQR
jgi:hypothetical protein